MSKYFFDVIIYYIRNYFHFSIDYLAILTYISHRYTMYITASCTAWLNITKPLKTWQKERERGKKIVFILEKPCDSFSIYYGK